MLTYEGASHPECAKDESRQEEQLLAAAAVIREASGASPKAIQAVISASTRLYATCCEAAGRELPPLNGAVSTTEAIVLACALLRSQNLNPFDLALWFSAGR